MKKDILSIAYFGSPDFSAGLLDKLVTNDELPARISLVCTQPDKPVGRKKRLTPTPVKETAQKHNIPCIEYIPRAKELNYYHIDLGVVYAYGLILPADILKSPPHGFWNIHPSLLPLYRGPSPIAYPLLLGDSITGTTLIKMDEKLDHGGIISQATMHISPTDNRQNLTYKLSDQGYDLILKELQQLADHHSDKGSKVTTRDQEHLKATYTKLFHKNDGFIPADLLLDALHGREISKEKLPLLIREYYDTYTTRQKCTYSRLCNSSNVVYNMFRGLYIWPGIWTTCTISGVEKRLKILDIDLYNGKLALKMVQVEGKTPVRYDQLTTNSEFSLSQ
jgi:methionyl-tRNA formyltransferase